MRIDTDKRIVNLGECVVDYDELKTVQMRDIIYKKETLFSEGEILLHEKFVGIIEGKIIRFLYLRRPRCSRPCCAGKFPRSLLQLPG